MFAIESRLMDDWSWLHSLYSPTLRVTSRKKIDVLNFYVAVPWQPQVKKELRFTDYRDYRARD